MFMASSGGWALDKVYGVTERYELLICMRLKYTFGVGPTRLGFLAFTSLTIDVEKRSLL
jgi:hypothetical protein